MSAAPTTRRSRAWPQVSLLALLALSAYANSFSVPFVFDDDLAIRQNADLRRLWPPWGALWPRSYTAVCGRPLTSLSFAVNYALGGYDVRGYHAINVAVHVLAAAALFGVVRRTLRRPALSSGTGGSGNGAALAVAALWVVHPLLSECVTYINVRHESLAALFYLTTLYCAIRRIEGDESAADDASRGTRRWSVLAVIACAAGMACKETMVTAPLMVLLYDRTLAAGSFGAALRRRRGLYVGLAATWLLLATFVSLAPRTAAERVHLSASAALGNLAMQSGVLAHYLRLAFWPHPLVVDYRDWPTVHGPADIPASGLLTLALGLGTAWALLKKRPAGVAGAAFFLILSPTSSFWPLPTEPAAERRMYLPLAAVIALVVLAVARRWPFARRSPGTVSKTQRVAQVAVVGLTVCGLGAATVRRNLAYASEVTLWEDVLAKRPNNAAAYNNLGYILRVQGQLARAVDCFERAVRLDPSGVTQRHSLAGALVEAGRFAEAARHAQEAIRLSPRGFGGHYNLGMALHGLGRLPEAEQSLRAAIEIDPKSSRGYAGLGLVCLARGAFVEAEAYFRRAMSVDPADATARFHLVSLLAMQHRIAEARAAIREARAAAEGSSADPAQFVAAAASLAYAMATRAEATAEEVAEALDLAREACERSGRGDFRAVNALAAACAAAGQFEEAVAAAEQAARLAEAAGLVGAAAQFRAQGQEYRRGRRHVEAPVRPG